MTRGQGVRRFCSFAWLLLFLWVIAAPIAANAVGVNVAGTWDLTVMTNIELTAPNSSSSDQVFCEWKGLMTLTQTGTDFTGFATLSLVTGPCAPISGTVQGTVGGTGSGFVIDFRIGQLSFDGIVSVDGQSADGTWKNEESGTWSAQKIRTAAPTLSGGGLATLFGLLLAAGALSAGRRAARTSTNG